MLAGRESEVCYGGLWQESAAFWGWQEMKPQVINSRAQMGLGPEVSEPVAQVP